MSATVIIIAVITAVVVLCKLLEYRMCWVKVEYSKRITITQSLEDMRPFSHAVFMVWCWDAEKVVNYQKGSNTYK